MLIEKEFTYQVPKVFKCKFEILMTQKELEEKIENSERCVIIYYGKCWDDEFFTIKPAMRAGDKLIIAGPPFFDYFELDEIEDYDYEFVVLKFDDSPATYCNFVKEKTYLTPLILKEVYEYLIYDSNKYISTEVAVKFKNWISVNFNEEGKRLV